MKDIVKKNNKAKTLKLIGIGLCVFGFFMLINTSQAQSVVGTAMSLAGKSILDIFSWGISIILYILSTIFASILMIGGWVFDWTLNLNSALLENPAVRVGWPIARDLTNLGFVLVILIIAFSTILRMGDFTAKKALPKLIIAALLINFSLLFVGIVLDFTGILTNFFINKGITGSGNGVGISQAIIGIMKVVNILQPPATLGAESFATFGAGMLTFIANLFFINIITAITAITMWAMAGMFLVRYVMLGLLVILMPLAILAWVLGRGEWKQWVESFTKYALFAPIASLFIYLAIATAQEFGAVQISAQQASVAPGLSNITANIGSMIMIITILLFGLGIAEKAAGMGAINATKMANGAMKFIGKAPFKVMGKVAGTTGKAVGTAGLMGGAVGAEKFGLSRIGRGTRFEGLLRPLRQLGTKAEEYGKARGGVKDIPSAVLEEITGGYGAASRKFRLQEQKQFKSEDKETARLAKKMVYFDPKLANDAEYMNEYKENLAKAEADIKMELNKPGMNLEKTTKEFEKQSTFNFLAKSAGIEPGKVKEFFDKNGEDMEITKKYFEREATIKKLMDSTFATRPQIEEALEKNFGAMKETRRALERLKDQNIARIAKEKEEAQNAKDEAHKDYMEEGFPRT